ncbi:transcriptional activator NhaR [Hyalangium gracile]|uniref:transcriptional activator NhaR n=1 Tax=Hyalangium gracile TaxID=394092 RepID=UPI001CCBF8BF|nr:transcriptional activator NhaR [Hyalangium gracile]
MAWLNYHHLLYFWTTARLGSIALASKELHLSQPTISTQIKLLEDSLGAELLQREGRKLVLTEMGHMVFRYADEIFRMGKELQLAVEGKAVGKRTRFVVGITDVIPKLVSERLLQPAFAAVPNLQLDCREGPLEQLLAQLALHELDVVISEVPATDEVKVRVFNHSLGETGISFFGSPKLAELRKGFPASLEGAPVLLPAQDSAVRRALDSWLEAKGIRPNLVAEFEDSALLKVFGQRGMGVFVAPTAIEAEVCRQYDVVVLGRTEDIKERFFAISVERKLKHPGVVAIAQAARTQLFA